MNNEFPPVIERLDLRQADVQRCLDVAREVIGEHQFVCLDCAPVIHEWNDADGASLVYEIPVDTTPSVAADLTMEVINRTVDRVMDLIGFAVAIKGVNTAA
ncbi:hypothetical protein [Aquabacterium sp.]|uniref:hypothetical protein n=1 Tax=Aquabacterium sp. TaxID=1872578 RepID=UPI00262E861A|nr:hypothetical protein [Aquabacterium sp.]MDD2978258.1 hypothetical protein [Aquabacterium sp.]